MTFFSRLHQQTLSDEITLDGIGIHSGKQTSISLKPAPEDAGIYFVLPQPDGTTVEIPARWDQVVDTMLCTVLGHPCGVKLATVEHVMAALWGAGIDNAEIIVQGGEIPILDGSSKAFFHAIAQVGVERQAQARLGIRVLRPVRVQHEDGYLEILPFDGFQTTLEVPLKGQATQRFHFDASLHSFGEIATARTFSYLDQVKHMQAAGFIKGGSLDNAVVLDGDRVLNPEGLRFKDECARHKTLDLIGDLALAGAPLLGRVKGRSPGHTLNHQLLVTLMQDAQAWEYITLGDKANPYLDTSIFIASKQPVAVFETSAYNR